MKENTVETLLGAVVLVFAGAFLFFMTQGTSVSGGASSYEVFARFRSAEGVAIGSDVRMAGVKIGSVTALNLDQETYLATTRFAVTGDIKIPDDSEVAVASEGLLGGAFVEIVPGVSDFMLGEGDEILNTQSAVSLLNLLIRFVTSDTGE